MDAHPVKITVFGQILGFRVGLTLWNYRFGVAWVRIGARGLDGGMFEAARRGTPCWWPLVETGGAQAVDTFWLASGIAQRR